MNCPNCSNTRIITEGGVSKCSVCMTKFVLTENGLKIVEEGMSLLNEVPTGQQTI